MTSIFGIAYSAGILVAVSIPIFTAQLNKARHATNQANIRAAKAAVVAEILDKGDTATAVAYNYTTSTGKLGTGTLTGAGAIADTAITEAYADSGNAIAHDKTYPVIEVYYAADGTMSYTLADK
jgi:type II secretory pathway pseudopilin PulG